MNREPLETFCETLLDLIRARSPLTAEFSSALSGLSQAVGTGCTESLGRLRGELNSLNKAAEQLRLVSQSPFFQVEREFEIVLGQLGHSSQRILKFIDALESLRRSAAGLPELQQLSVAVGISNPQAPAPDSSDEIAESRLKHDHETTVVEEPDVSAPRQDRATAFFEEAEKCRQRGQLRNAESLYTKSLYVDAEFIPSLRYRGRVRLLSRQVALAIEDLTRALRLDDRDPIAFCWRGDAHTVGGGLNAAIEDYSRALELRPDFFLAAYNRAVAYRLNGDLSEALSEFDSLAKLQPTHGAVYLNRGLVFQLQGNMQQAVADFQRALRLQPASSEAMQCLKAAKVLMEDDHQTINSADAVPSTVSRRREPGLSPETSSVSATLLAQTDSVGVTPNVTNAVSTSSPPSGNESRFANIEVSEFLLSMQPEVSTVPSVPIIAVKGSSPLSQESSGDAPGKDRPEPRRDVRDSMTVRCPACAMETSLRWNKLQPGRVLACPKCRRHFTLTHNGELSEIVKEANGKWTFFSRIAERRREKRMRLLQIGGATAAILVSATIFFWGNRIGQNLAVAEATLPTDLEPRTELFARAWLTGDSRTMRRLTDPAHDRLLFTWYRRNSPPPLKSDSETVPKDVKVEMIKLPSQPPMALMRVRFDGLAINSDQPPAELQLAWEERSGNWIFNPVQQ